MTKEGRPLSPHLTIYRWPITMMLSILHRISGFALAVGFIVFVAWLEAIAFESVPFETFSAALQSTFGQLALFGWLFCFFFHLANGIRHLIWDSGHLLEKQQADTSAWFVLLATVVLSVGYWLTV